MSVDVSMTPAAALTVTKLQRAVAAALASVPPIPSGASLVSAALGGNIFEGQIDLPVTFTPEAEAFLAELTAKFNAFAAAK